MPLGDAIMASEVHRSYGTVVLDHLAADGASLTGGQVTVVTVSQVYANFLSSLHLKTVHSFPCLGNIDLVVVLHTLFLSFSLSSEKAAPSEESTFLSATIALPFLCVI